jgi:hypothetical protein
MLLVFYISFFTLFSIGHFGGDGYGDFLVARNLVLKHSLVFDQDIKQVDVLDYNPKVTTVGRDGNFYSSRSSFGMPLILSLFYAIGYLISGIFKTIPLDFITNFAASFVNPVILAFSCLFIFLIALELSFSLRISLFLSFIFAFSTMAPVYARTGFADLAVVLFLLIAVYYALRYKNSLRTEYLIFSALSLAYAAFTKPYAIIFFPCLAFYLFWVIKEQTCAIHKKLSRASLYALSVIIPLILIGLYNWYIYGGFFKFGGSAAFSIGKRIVQSPHLTKGLYYYLLSTGKSLFLFNLPLILAIVGIFKADRARRKETALFILLFVINLFFFVKSFRRGSLFSWGPRYLLPSVAALVFFIGYFLEKTKAYWEKISLMLFSIAGFLVMFPCLFINQSKFYFFVKNELKLDEYLVNFVPDLSPILGAWQMFISRIAVDFFNVNLPFVYNPDYKLVSPVSVSMDKYNFFDSWFLKVGIYAPALKGYAIIALLILAALIFISSFFILKWVRFEENR